MAWRLDLVVRLAGWQALCGARNHLFSDALGVHHFAWQKLLSRTRISDALCSGRSRYGTTVCSPIEMVQDSIARRYSRDRSASCATGGTDFAACQACHVHACDWDATAAH